MKERNKVTKKVLSREEIPLELISAIHKKFSSPVIDIKKDFVEHPNSKVFSTKGNLKRGTKINKIVYKVTVEPRFADIVAIVKVEETTYDP